MLQHAYYHILTFLDTKSLQNLSLLSKEYNEFLSDKGYFKSIKFSQQLEFTDFINIYSKHYRTIEKVIVTNCCYKNFIEWIPDYKECLHLHNCTISHFDPPFILDKVTTLKCDNLITYSHCIKINWEKFPNLKELYIFNCNVETENIKVCKKLNKVIVDVPYHCHDYSLSEDLFFIPSLQYLITSTYIKLPKEFNNQNKFKVFVGFCPNYNPKNKAELLFYNSSYFSGKNTIDDDLTNTIINRNISRINSLKNELCLEGHIDEILAGANTINFVVGLTAQGNEN